MKSRACEIRWQPDRKDKKYYKNDCEQYEKEIKRYINIANEWNGLGGGDFRSFLGFAVRKARELKKFHSSD